jgi:hypothetical protein
VSNQKNPGNAVPLLPKTVTSMHVCFETKPNSCVHLRECQRLLNAVSVIEAQLWLAAANKNETGLLFELCRVVRD